MTAPMLAMAPREPAFGDTPSPTRLPTSSQPRLPAEPPELSLVPEPNAGASQVPYFTSLPGYDDGAGEQAVTAYDFRGNPLAATRRLAAI